MPRIDSFAAIAAELGKALGSHCDPAPERAVGGGCINDCYKWMTGAGAAFVKVTQRDRYTMFESEAEGLRELAAARAVRVPEVLALGSTSQHAFLALEWISPERSGDVAQSRLGAQLAAQHRVLAAQFGWHRDNTIGLTPQRNARSSDWLTFFREQRLRYQLELACEKGFARLLRSGGEQLLAALDDLLAGHSPQPSLLHGDLWGGNWFATAGQAPVIVDPAVYYGDREADLAMTHLFGGFGAEFYRAYEAAWPLPSGHEKRRELYNLYHVLNHANLFGGGYAHQARAIIDRLLAS